MKNLQRIIDSGILSIDNAAINIGISKERIINLINGNQKPSNNEKSAIEEMLLNIDFGVRETCEYEMIKNRLKNKGIKKKWIAEQIGITPILLSYYLNGKRKMPEHIQEKIYSLIQ